MHLSSQSSGELQPRPCLAHVESLDDRILLSVSPSATVVNEGGGDAAILIALLKASQPLVADELSALQLAAAKVDTVLGKVDLFRLGQELGKVDETVFRFADSLIKGDFTLGKVMPLITSEFAKVDALVTQLGGNADSALLPAVQKVEGETSALIGLLSKLQGGDLMWKDAMALGKVTEAFARLDTDLVKVQTINLGLSLDKHMPAAVLSKIEDMWIKGDFGKVDEAIKGITDPALLPAVQSAEQAAMDIATGLLGQDFGGGVTTPTTGDVIS